MLGGPYRGASSANNVPRLSRIWATVSTSPSAALARLSSAELAFSILSMSALSFSTLASTAGHMPSTAESQSGLAAGAERTRRIPLGTAVVTLPLEDPVRVAEDAAVLDALSGGRVELGVGSGADPAVFAAFGKDLGRRREDLGEVTAAESGDRAADAGAP